MHSGLLVRTKFGDTHVYTEVGSWKRFVGTFESNSVGLLLDAEISDTDVYYYKVYVDGMLGWTKAEHLEAVT
jgi:hypothetical protein